MQEPSTALDECLGVYRVTLEAMSPEAECVLAEHNQEAIDSLVAYISRYVSAHLDSLPPAIVLPLSGFAYPPTTTAASKSATGLRQQPSAACGGSAHATAHPSGMSEGGGALHTFRKGCRISSPFAALSGRHIQPQLFSFQFACERKENFMLFSNHNASLLRRQPGAQFACVQMLNGSACALHAQECSAHIWLVCGIANASVWESTAWQNVFAGCCAAVVFTSHCKGGCTLSVLLMRSRQTTHCTLAIISASTSHDSLTAGHAEDFSSLEEVVQSVRPGILLDAASVPSVHMTDRHGRVLPLNRYLLDYWGHCQKQALTLANGLREGDH